MGEYGSMNQRQEMETDFRSSKNKGIRDTRRNGNIKEKDIDKSDDLQLVLFQLLYYNEQRQRINK